MKASVMPDSMPSRDAIIRRRHLSTQTSYRGGVLRRDDNSSERAEQHDELVVRGDQ